jgi:hypothetical protein
VRGIGEFGVGSTWNSALETVYCATLAAAARAKGINVVFAPRCRHPSALPSMVGINLVMGVRI